MCKAHGRILSMSLKPSGVLQPEGMCACARSSSALSLVQVMWTRLWSVAPPPLSVPAGPSVSSSSSEPMLVKRSIEFLSFTSWAYTHTHKSNTGFNITHSIPNNPFMSPFSSSSYTCHSLRYTHSLFLCLTLTFTPSVFFYISSLCTMYGAEVDSLLSTR